MKTEVSTVTAKGQLVIPSKLRRKYLIKEGTQVAFLEQENRPVESRAVRDGKDQKLDGRVEAVSGSRELEALGNDVSESLVSPCWLKALAGPLSPPR